MPSGRDTRAPHTVLAIALLAPMLWLTGCGGPCEALAQRICRCTTPSTLEGDACVRRVVQGRTVLFTEEQEMRCSQDLESCQCDDLRNGKQSDCGRALGIDELTPGGGDPNANLPSPPAN